MQINNGCVNVEFKNWKMKTAGILYNSFTFLIISNYFFFFYSHTVFSYTGHPNENSTDFKSLEAMLRVYIGISKHSTDVNVHSTYRATRILNVIQKFVFAFTLCLFS